MTYQQSCKKCLSVIDKNHQIIQRVLAGSKTLRHLDTSLLQKRVAELQASSQVWGKEGAYLGCTRKSSLRDRAFRCTKRVELFPQVYKRTGAVQVIMTELEGLSLRCDIVEALPQVYHGTQLSIWYTPEQYSLLSEMVLECVCRYKQQKICVCVLLLNVFRCPSRL